ncbi:MAG: carbamoyltransferase N-terminal domain-containing protein, partial [Terriglobales bacterium]
MYILGINAYHGDAAAALVKDGHLVAAVEEERFNRKKHCAGFPTLAVRYCLEEAGIKASDLDHIGISRDPSANLHKKILFSMSRLTKVGNLIGTRLANAAKVRSLKDELARALGISSDSFRAQFHNVEHHKAHMASCFLVSDFDRAAILSIDGFGDFISTMWGLGEGVKMQVLGEIEFPHSMGCVYTATTQFLGFPHYGDEGKVMGLAPYGKPRFLDQFRE